MTKESPKEQKNEIIEHADTPVADDTVVDSGKEKLDEKTQATSSSNGLVWFALVLTWAAIAAAGYLGWPKYQAMQAAVQIASQQAESINEQRLAIQAIDEKSSGVQQRLAGQSGQITQIASQLQAADQQLAQIATINQQLVTMAGKVERATRTSDESWQLAEVEYLLSLAQQRALLGASPETTLRMLDSAASVLTTIDEVATIPVRQAIENDKLRLKSMKSSQRVDYFLRVTALLNQIDSLAMQKVRTSEAQREQEIDADPSSFTDYISRVIRVKKAEPPKPLRTPEQELFLRQNVTMDLKVMQWALLQGEQTVFDQSVISAQKWLSWGFDDSNPLKQQFDEGLDELAKLDVSVQQSVELTSLAAFKLFASSGETAQ